MREWESMGKRRLRNTGLDYLCKVSANVDGLITLLTLCNESTLARFD